MSKKHTTVAKRLHYLANMLNKYAHCWSKDNGQDPSSRMFDWVDEYNSVKFDNLEAWEFYCKTYGRSYGHDAYDCMA
jgi:hypothetical protein